MATSALFGAIDGLLAMCNAQTGAGGLLENVLVVDGPFVVESELSDADILVIGDTPDDDPTATSQQDFGPYGRGARDEQIQIVCTASSTGGEPDMKPRRDRVKAILAAVEKLVRQNAVPTSDPSLGGSVLWCRITEQRLLQLQTEYGAEAEMTFTVAARARL
jgi:hypothetical protein